MERQVSDFFNSMALSIIGLTMLVSIILLLKNAVRISTTDLLLVLIVFGIGGYLVVNTAQDVTKDMRNAVRTLLKIDEV
jgi:hypothetical protein